MLKVFLKSSSFVTRLKARICRINVALKNYSVVRSREMIACLRKIQCYFRECILGMKRKVCFEQISRNN